MNFSKRLIPLACVVLTASCSIKSIAIDAVADSLANGPDVFGSDEDPELVRDSLPFALKAVEALLASAPQNEDLLLTASRGFTQYAFAFIEAEADDIEDWEEAERKRERALKMYLRARDYGLRGLELEVPDIAKRLVADPKTVVRELGAKSVPLMYWTASAWGSAIGLGIDRPDLIADADVARALIQRALELDESWDDGAIHEAMIVVESFPEAMGGSPERARGHFLRAVELSRGLNASPFVTMAEKVAVPSQNREEFESLLGQALAVDPDAAPSRRLLNLITQRRARKLLAQAGELFL